MSTSTTTERCPNCERLERRVAELEAQIVRMAAQIEKLTAALEESQRSGKRQAAPFRKPKKAKPKKPGRKSGSAHGKHAHRLAIAEKDLDETIAVSLPACCPECRSTEFVATRVDHQYQTEIIRKPHRRRFDIQIATCKGCGATVQGRHELQTSDALGAAASQLGADAHAALSILNKEMGLSHGKCAKVFKRLFGIEISRSTSVRSIRRTGEKAEAAYEQIRDIARASPWNVPDETGWRIDGGNAWLHVTVSALVTCYVIAQSRGHRVLAEILGIDYTGKMIHDGFKSYDCFLQAIHQTCLNHLLKRCKQLLEVASRGAVRFPRAVQALLKQALSYRKRYLEQEISYHGLQVMRGRLTQQMRRLVLPTKTNADNERFATHLYRHLDELFTFLIYPEIDATNYRAEQAIRPAVVNRKVWGGNRTEAGAVTQQILMSVIVTCHQNQLCSIDFLSKALRATKPTLIFRNTR